MRPSRTACSLSALAGIAMAVAAQAAPLCPGSILSQPKGNSLYLYFPTAVDNAFPDYGLSGDTSPLAAFDVADLEAGIGTTAQLRNRVFDFVTDDYCEFNVSVNQTTTAPAPAEARWLVMGLGTDAEISPGSSCLFGEAQGNSAGMPDAADNDPQDFARIWADSFGQCDLVSSGVAFNASFTGANATLERWATGIGETAAHEAAHNYGAGHGHSAPRSGSAEDETNNHIMATGSTGLTAEIRATRNRHFSDTEYEILGHNVGLNIKTLHNWDFINPNDTNANGLRIRLLSTAASLTIGWWYNGSTSPWQNPTVASAGTQSFQGTTYNVFNLDFTSAKAWSGGANGVVGPGVEFHTGASFTGSASVIVFRVQLLNGGSPLPLAPRLPGYDVGTADLATGDFNLSFFNTDPSAGDLIITSLELRRLPRMMDIGAMVRGAEPADPRGIPIRAHDTRRFERLDVKEATRLTIAKLTDKRTVDIVYRSEDCPPGSIGSGTKPGVVPVGDAQGFEVNYCMRGTALSLFPSTYTYVVATVVEPDAKVWDVAQAKFVTRDLESRIFYQFSGIVPDFNGNGQDDLVDIRSGQAPDENGNGVPDGAEPAEPDGGGCSWWAILIAIVVIALIAIVLWLLWWRKP